MHEPTLCADPTRCKACRARIGRRYISTRVEDATRLRKYCTDRAVSVMKEHLARLEKSRAIDSNIVIPAPPGLSYLPYQKAGIAYMLQHKDTLNGDEPGLGKDQPLDAKILTPGGWRRMGDIKVGDLTIGSDGQSYPVTGVYPQGLRPVYRVTFQDGATTECGAEHLWEVNTPCRQWRGYAPRIMTTLQILEKGLTEKGGKRRHIIRIAKPYNFKSRQHLIHPYVMGYLLGNGGLSQTSVRVTIPDAETLDRIASMLPKGFHLSKQTPIDYVITGIGGNKGKPNIFLNEMRRFGLMGHLTYEKFIPAEYLWDKVANRAALLQGLIDSDGHVRPTDNNIEYSSSSPQLARDVQQLIWSLGGTAKIRPKKTPRRMSYRMSVCLPKNVPPCQLSRKKNSYHPRPKYQPHRVIDKIEAVGYKETQCIAVASPDHLYITNDFILTHNTIQALGFMNVVRPKTTLVVAPATLAYNWMAEAEKWLTDGYHIFVPGTGNDAIPTVDPDQRLMVITNYEKVVGITRKKVEYETAFSESIKREWDVVIYDEAHAVKNPSSKRSQAVLGKHGLYYRARRNLFLTGTPIENYPKEIWPIAATICPVKFGDWIAFAQRYCGLHEEDREGIITQVSTGGTHLSELQQRLRTSFMVRRLKHDVLKELPPKRRQLVILGDEEVDWSRHPEFRRWKELYEKDYEAAMARVEAARTAEEYRRAVKALDAFLGVPFTEMSDFRHKTALAKLPLCLKYIDDLLATGLENIVIFAHHKDVLAKIHEHYKDQSCVLYGDTPMERRGEIIRDFQAGRYRIFIGGLKAAGTGITLTRASTVVYIEIDWNPATLTQSEDRLCRIGQKKMVHVIHLVLNNTLDVNMSQKVIRKQDMIDRALDHLPKHLRMEQVGAESTGREHLGIPDPR